MTEQLPTPTHKQMQRWLDSLGERICARTSPRRNAITEQIPTPTPEQVQRWIDYFQNGPGKPTTTEDFFLAACAAEWGADQELKACIKLLSDLGGDGEMIRRHRRPKPKSLAEEGYDALDTYIYGNPDPGDKERTYNTLRRALERLQELEGQG